MSNMKKLIIFTIIICCFFVTGCEKFPMPTERETTTREIITSTAIVESYDEHHWYAGYAHHYRFTVNVYCEEHNIRKTFEDTVSGMWVKSSLQDLKKGTVVNVEIIKETTGDKVTTYLHAIKK